MTWRVRVELKKAFLDHRGEALKREAHHFGLTGVRALRTGAVYELEGTLDQTQALSIAGRLLADPITQEFSVAPPPKKDDFSGGRRAVVWLKKGVADPVADTVFLASKDLSVQGLESVRSGHVFDFLGTLSGPDVRRFCEEHLMNSLIQTVDVC